MRYITLGEILSLHSRIVSQSGGSPGIRDFGGIASAVAQPRVSVGGIDAYPSLIEKAAVLGFALSQNHGFVDGNKRIAHAAIETFLILNDFELEASVDEQESTVLQLAAGTLTRESLVSWLEEHVTAIPT
jgi:death-on-curing protein